MEKKQLTEILSKARKNLMSAPEGNLRVSFSNNSIQFYNNRKYISKSNVILIRKLAQKRYDHNVVLTITKELKKDNFDPLCVEKLLNIIPNSIREYITPYAISNEEYASLWVKAEYITKEDKGIYITSNNERVRSKSEVMIADRLKMMGIPYRYEARVKLLKDNTYYYYFPDFTILNKKTRQEIILEHFGMMDNTEYVNKAIDKINTYAANGYIQGKNIIYTFETKEHPLNMNTIILLITTYLQ